MLFETRIPPSIQNAHIDCKQLYFDLNGKEIRKEDKFNDSWQDMPHTSIKIPVLLPQEEEVSNNTQDANDNEDEDEDDHFSPQNVAWSDSSDDGEYEQVSYSSEDGEPNYDDEDDDDFGSKNKEYYFSRRSSLIEEEEEEVEEHFAPEPFWYTFEDPEQICGIFSVYEKFLIKPEERTRSSQLFVGQIKRMNATFGDVFQTFDTVVIHNQQISSDFPIIPEDHVVHLLTTWDKDEGIPTSLFIINEEKGLNFWGNRVQIRGSVPSILYCEPHYYAREEYVYSSSPVARENAFQFDDKKLMKKQIISW